MKKMRNGLVVVLDGLEFLIHVATLTGTLLLVGHAVGSAVISGGIRPFVSLFVAIVLIGINLFLRLMNDQRTAKAN